MPKKHDPLTCRNEDHDICLDAQVEEACTCRTCPMHTDLEVVTDRLIRRERRRGT